MTPLRPPIQPLTPPTATNESPGPLAQTGASFRGEKRNPSITAQRRHRASNPNPAASPTNPAVGPGPFTFPAYTHVPTSRLTTAASSGFTIATSDPDATVAATPEKEKVRFI